MRAGLGVKVEWLHDVVERAHKGQAREACPRDAAALHRAPVAVAEAEELQGASKVGTEGGG